MEGDAARVEEMFDDADAASHDDFARRTLTAPRAVTDSLRFDKIRLAGFKSFVEPTDFAIEPGLTGIIGPNGCGKSNLLEAIRWVMGANSAKAMRAGAMDDVIFSGTKSRPGRSSAQVTLTIDNSARVAPPQFNDEETLEVSRTITKGAGSKYRVNGQVVRAKDVQLLFADSSTGANSPALVRQGQISELIAAKPQNRRRILEEAAGISGLHSRRHEAELRLRAAETNLARLDDVIGQVEGLLHSLKRQSRQARRYKKLAGEIHRFKALLWLIRWRAATDALDAATADNARTAREVEDTARASALAQTELSEATVVLEPLREENLIASSVHARLDAAREVLERDEEAAKAEVAKLETAVDQLSGDLARELGIVEDAEAARGRLDAEHESLSAVADVTDALETARVAMVDALAARGELEDAFNELTRRTADRKARAEAAERERDQVTGRIARLERELEKTRARIAGLGEADVGSANLFNSAADAALRALGAARTTAREAREHAEATQGEVDTCREALSRARSAAGQLEAEARAVETMLAQGASTDHAPAIESIEVQPGYEQALSAALGEDLNAAVGEAGETAWMGANAPGMGLDGGLALSEVVTAPEQLAARLSQVFVVDDSVFERAAKELAPGQRIVTRAGHMARWDGFAMAAGAVTAAAQKLAQANRLAELAPEIAAARAVLGTAQAAFDAAREAQDVAKRSARSAREAVPALEAEERTARQSLTRYEADAARAASERRGLDERRTGLEGELRESRDARDAAEARVNETAVADDLEARERELAARLLDAREAADEASVAYKSLKSDADARSARLASVTRERADWARRAEAAQSRVAQLQARLDGTEARLADLQSGPDPFAERRQTLLSRLSEAEARRAEAGDALAKGDSRARDADRAARETEAAAGRAREARAGAQARLTAAGERVEEVAARIREAMGGAPEDLPEKLGDLEMGSMGEADAERRVEKLSSERERMGAVNLRADEEAEAEQEKLDVMMAERGDLEAAIAKLREGIDELNTEGRQRLLAAFDVVNGHFGKLFTTLFEGGEANLALTESDDPLEAGLDIMVSPPGKALGSMSLLSGGEQALTATALIFAVFLSNPAPICVLDEVDAPLDDFNVARYCALLDEMAASTHTKFIAITHNAVTMSRMDRLFGVTMAERGVSQLLSVELDRAVELAE